MEEILNDTQLNQLLIGKFKRNIFVTIKEVYKKNRKVKIRPINYDTVRKLLYKHWIHANEKAL